jgi:formate/nitrite transporter FocA (FNT family)
VTLAADAVAVLTAALEISTGLESDRAAALVAAVAAEKAREGTAASAVVEGVVCMILVEQVAWVAARVEGNCQEEVAAAVVSAAAFSWTAGQ